MPLLPATLQVLAVFRPVSVSPGSSVTLLMPVKPPLMRVLAPLKPVPLSPVRLTSLDTARELLPAPPLMLPVRV